MKKTKQRGAKDRKRLTGLPVPRWLLLAELLVITWAIFSALRLTGTITFAGTDLKTSSPYVRAQRSADGVLFVQDGSDHDLAESECFRLTPGHYYITVRYNAVPVRYEDETIHRAVFCLLSEDIGAVENETCALDALKQETTFSFSVTRTTERAYLLFHDDTSGALEVLSVEIRGNAVFSWTMVVAAILACLAVDLVLAKILPQSPWYAGEENTKTLLVILAVATLASVPVLQANGYQLGHDWCFHTLRIEGIANALKNGQFPVRLYGESKNGFGYALSLFYGEIFLYFPALLRILGVSVQGAYQVYLTGVNLVTAWLCCRCFGRIFHSAGMGRIGCFLYTLAPYRLYNLHIRSALGEYTAMAFFPLVIYGVWRLYSPEDSPQGDRERGTAWLPIALGFSGILQSHLLSTGMTAAFTALVCLLLFKKTFRPSVLLTWGKAVGATAALNAWFLLPFINTMATGLYTGMTSGEVDYYALEPTGLFNFDLNLNTAPAITIPPVITAAPGTALMLGMACLPGVLVLYGGRQTDKRIAKLGMIAFLTGALALWMSTLNFPWLMVQELPVIGAALTMVQFPMRYLAPASALGTVSTLCALQLLGQAKKEQGKTLLAFACILLSVVGAQMMLELTLGNKEYVGDASQIIYYPDSDWAFEMDDLYLPEGAIPGRSLFRDVVRYNDGFELGEFQTQNGATRVECTERSGKESVLQFPLVYFPCYRVTGQSWQVACTENGMVGVTIPAGYSGTVEVKVRERIPWRLAELLSLCMAGGMLVFYRRGKMLLKI